MSIKNRLAQLEKQQPQTPHTWKDLVTGAWQPSPAEWAEFVARARPSEILAHAETLIQQGATVTDEQRRALDSIRTVTK